MGVTPPFHFVQLPAHQSCQCSPSESTHTVWCCPPENPTQDLVEFLKHVRFCGEKQGSVPWVPAGWDAQTQADQIHRHRKPRPGTSTEPFTLGLTPPETNTDPHDPKANFCSNPPAAGAGT